MKGRVQLPIVLLFRKVTILEGFVCLEVEKITGMRLKRMTDLIGETIKEPYFTNPIYHLSLFKVVAGLSA